jgi:Rps23 Pro-64 3,4-dihydroxylase Tpa1-like proline 4-hydroxylase
VSFDLRDYIVVFENIISDDLCNEVLDEYNNDKNWINTTTSGGLNRDIRRCDAINMSDSFIVQQNHEKRKNIDDKLFSCAGEAIKKYNDKFKHARIQGDSGYTLLRYQEGEFYSEHTDNFLQSPRIVSCSFTLNNDFEGGEFGFFNRELVYKPPKGSALMFPSNFLYPHEVMPVTRRVRYSIITWFI